MSGTFDVLVQTRRDALEHKMDGAVPVGHLPFWRVTGTPRRTEPGRAILFSDGQRVIARGVIVEPGGSSAATVVQIPSNRWK